MKEERKEYIGKLIKSIRQDFLMPVEIVDGEPVFDFRYIDIALLCDMVEKECLPHIAELEAEIKSLKENVQSGDKALYTYMAENQKLRELLWLNHGHTELYGDDGELQCAKCRIDFKRMPINEIVKIWHDKYLEGILKK